LYSDHFQLASPDAQSAKLLKKSFSFF